MRLDDLHQELQRVLHPREALRRLFPDWSGINNERVPCPFHEDTNPSLSLSATGNGKANCFGCPYQSSNYVGLAGDLWYGESMPGQGSRGRRFARALRILYSEQVDDLSKGNEQKRQHKKLLRSPNTIKKLERRRGWTQSTIEDFNLGWDTEHKRISIPVIDHLGVTKFILLHDSLNLDEEDERTAMLSPSDGSLLRGFWFPLQFRPFRPSGTVWLMEGEPDTITARTMGLNAVTVVGGTSGWLQANMDAVQGQEVIVCLDGDESGRGMSEFVCAKAHEVGAKSVRDFIVPNEMDFTEWVRKELMSLEDVLEQVPEPCYMMEDQVAEPIKLADIWSSEHKHVRFRALVQAADAETVYTIPRKLNIACGGDDLCDSCPCAAEEGGAAEVHVHKHEPRSLAFLACNATAKITSEAKKLLELPKDCDPVIEEDGSQFVFRGFLAPLYEDVADGADHLNVPYLSIGSQLKLGQVYEITATITPNPLTTKTETILLITSADEIEDDIQSFNLHHSIVNEMDMVFRGHEDSVYATLQSIARYHSLNNTGIWGREDLHILADLVFHGPSDFMFQGQRLPKGSIEALVLGDTRTGKGTVIEGLIKHYKLGEVVNCENATERGLTGGSMEWGGKSKWLIVWGRIPMNHLKLVMMDEASGLDPKVLGGMSRVRSEGKVEVVRVGKSVEHPANVRMLWVSNPRDGSEVLSKVTYGIEAVMHWADKKQEDVARFDIALITARNEVSHDLFNMQRPPRSCEWQIGMLRDVVKWAWSLKVNQVHFTENAEDAVLTYAKVLAELYSPDIPLLQIENARFKIAKLSAAVAARCFSHDGKMELVVDREHVLAACIFLRKCYDKPAMAFNAFSARSQELRMLEDLDEVFNVGLSNDIRDFCQQLLDNFTVTSQDLHHYLPVKASRGLAENMMRTFVQCNALRKCGPRNYTTTRSFKAYLKAKIESIDNPPPEKSDDEDLADFSTIPF